MIYSFNDNNLEDFQSAFPDNRTDAEQLNSILSVYNNEAPEIKTARAIADEMVNVSGGPVTVYLRTDDNSYDAVWDENADPTYWNPVVLKAYYKPEGIELELKKWGVEGLNKIDIIFSHRQVHSVCGDRMIRTGDVIKLNYNATNNNLAPANYRVLNGTPSGNFRYTWLYFKCTVETLAADITVQPEGQIQVELDIAEVPYRETI